MAIYPTYMFAIRDTLNLWLARQRRVGTCRPSIHSISWPPSWRPVILAWQLDWYWLFRGIWHVSPGASWPVYVGTSTYLAMAMSCWINCLA